MARKISLLLCLALLVAASPLQAQNPVAYAGTDQHICEGDTVELQGVGSGAGPVYTYQWSPNAWISDPTLPNPRVWPPVPTAYSLVVTSNALSSQPDTAVVFVHAVPTVDAGTDQGICLGDSAQLMAQGYGDSLGVYQYQWTPASTLNNAAAQSPLASPLQSTTYHVVAESLWGCASPPDSVAVTIQPTPMVEAGQDQIICIGDSFLLQGSYTWVTGDTLPASQLSHAWSPASPIADPGSFVTTALADSSRWFYLQVTAGSCVRVDSIRATAFPRPMPVITQSGNDLYANGGLGGGSYQWYLNSLPITGANGNIYTATQPGCYSVEVSEGACVGLSDTLCIQSVGLGEAVSWGKLEVFPNPFQEEFSIEVELGRADELRITLTGTDGKILQEWPAVKWGAGPHLLKLEVPELPGGIYWLRVQGKNGALSRAMLHGAQD